MSNQTSAKAIAAAAADDTDDVDALDGDLLRGGKRIAKFNYGLRQERRREALIRRSASPARFSGRAWRPLTRFQVEAAGTLQGPIGRQGAGDRRRRRPARNPKRRNHDRARGATLAPIETATARCRRAQIQQAEGTRDRLRGENRDRRPRTFREMRGPPAAQPAPGRRSSHVGTRIPQKTIVFPAQICLARPAPSSPSTRPRSVGLATV
jgi:hypothetical protein